VTTLDSRIFAGLCAPGLRPLSLTQALVLWLRHHFGDTAAVGETPVAGRLETAVATGPLPRMVWQAGPATGIGIEPDWRWVPELTERRPALIVQRGDLKQVQLGIGDKMQGLRGDGRGRYEVGWTGQHAVLAIGGEGAEVELLAAETARELVQFAPVVRSLLDMKKLRVEGVAKLAILKTDARDNFVAAISLTYTYVESWIAAAQAPPLVAAAATFTSD